MTNFSVEYYTDPLCCWSWGMEPQMRKLRYLLRNHLKIRYVMGGLIRDWERFSDHMNDINRPSQVGPLWMEARNTTGQPMQEVLWIKDPVDTTYPACMAVKAAELQGNIAGEAMLRELREAVMLRQLNIGKNEVILEIASALEKKKILDFSLFQKDWFSNRVAELFRKDLEQIKIKGITRFPTLLISVGKRTIQITGYRPFPVLLDAFRNLDPELDFADDDINPEEYKKSWANLTERELQEIQPERKDPAAVHI